MKIKDKSEIKLLREMVGKSVCFRTSRGKSLPHIVERIELTDGEVIFVLKNKHSALIKRRRASVVELINIEDKIKLSAKARADIKKNDRIAEKKAEKKEEAADKKMSEKIAEIDRLNKLAKENEERRAD